MSIPEPERELLLRIGLVMNDLWLLQRLALAVRRASAGSDAATEARAVHFLNLLLMTAGKVFEATEVYRKFFLSSPHSASQRARFDQKTVDACKQIQRLTGSTNLLSFLRNEMGFHYPQESLSDQFNGVADDDELSLYLGAPDGQYTS